MLSAVRCWIKVIAETCWIDEMRLFEIQQQREMTKHNISS